MARARNTKQTQTRPNTYVVLFLAIVLTGVLTAMAKDRKVDYSDYKNMEAQILSKVEEEGDMRLILNIDGDKYSVVVQPAIYNSNDVGDNVQVRVSTEGIQVVNRLGFE